MFVAAIAQPRTTVADAVKGTVTWTAMDSGAAMSSPAITARTRNLRITVLPSTRQYVTVTVTVAV
jgi:hypothetical protein